MSESRKKALEARLDPRQRIAALLCVERELTDEVERKSFDEIAAEVGVSRQALYKWRTQNKTFIEYVNLLADDFLESKRARVYNRMMKLIDSDQPSVKALDLYMRRFGLLTDKSVVETKDSGPARTNEDIAQEIAELDDLIGGDGPNENG